MKWPVIIIGAQWGDEGKGKAVDILAKEADMVVRFNGGNNAGHTVVVNHEKFPLSLLPSGVLWQKKLLISQGVVITPEVLLAEIDFFQKRKIKVDLSIDFRANVVMPYHKLLDEATEISKGVKKVGSLKLGIGYCYEDRNNRHGIRMEDLVDPIVLREKLEAVFPRVKKRIETVFGYDVNITSEGIFQEYVTYGMKLKKYLADVSGIIYSSLSTKKVLFEGAHGTFLDGNFGTYPFTTAVNTISGSVFSYVGIPPQSILVLGVVKAYTTRVGGGPFPAELSGETGKYIQEKGNEFGTVSKRPRRCGWLDLVMLKYAKRLNGFRQIMLTKLDVLSGLHKIKIATHYKLRGKNVYSFPSSLHDVEQCNPVYESYTGWKEDISYITKFNNLPKNCQIYIKAIEKHLEVFVKYISIGPDRISVIKH